MVSRDNRLKPFSTLITSLRFGLVPGVESEPHEVADKEWVIHLTKKNKYSFQMAVNFIYTGRLVKYHRR